MKALPLSSLRLATIGALVAAACLLPSPVQADSPTLATVGGTPITAAEIEQALRLPLYDLEVEKYRLTRRKLDQTIVERLLARAAAERGQTVSAFVTAEVQARIATITSEEIAARVRADRAKLPPDEEQAHTEARSALVRERAGRALQELVERLSREAQVTVALRSPEPPVMTVPAGDGPAWGAPAAPVTVVEFADFECPVCKENLPILQEVRSLYREQVRIVYRNFPLASHPQARPAAEAAHCAHEQGQFWAYHDGLFAKAPDLQPSDYVQLAERLKLNTADFTACLSSNRPKVAVAKDLADAQALGLSGTPTFFVNGRYLSGFQTLDTLRQYIDRELRAAQNGAHPGDAVEGAGAR
jgi:protein-disulfide isomerase